MADEEKDVNETKEEKCGSMSYYVPMSVVSFNELEAMQKAAQTGRAIQDLTYQFKELVTNIVYSTELNNKSGAIKKLTEEYTSRLESTASYSEKKEMDDTSPLSLLGDSDESHEKSPIKREGGIDFPAQDYAWVPDPAKPATWKIRLTESPGKVSLAQLGKAAATLSTGGFRGQKAQIPQTALSAVKRRIRAEYRKMGVPETSIPSSIRKEFSVWKSVEDGKWHWFAVYSNNFRDRDNPPEIISEKSHKTFVGLVEQNLVSPPELWHWHLPGTKWGTSEVVGYENGFAWAAGVVDEGHEKEAESLSKQDDIRVSHGMPSRFLKRLSDDPTVIDFHITSEISPLPGWAAANEHTGFNTFQGVQPMTAAQKKYLKDAAGLSDQEITERELALASKEQEVEDEGVERKGEDGEEEKKEETLPSETKELVEALGAITGILKEMRGKMNSMEDEIKQLKLSDAEKIEEKSRLTPALSMKELIRGIVYEDDTAEIEKDNPLLKGKPKKVKKLPKVSANGYGSTGVGYLDNLLNDDE